MVKGLLATIALATAGALAFAVPAAAQQAAGPWCDLHEAPAAESAPRPLDASAVQPGVSVVVMPGPRLTLTDIKPGAVVRGPHEPGPPERLAPRVTTLAPTRLPPP